LSLERKTIMNRKIIFSGAVLLSGFLLAPAAHAAHFVCNGNPVVWEDPFEVTQNTFSIPNGSTRESDLENAVGRWNGVQGMANMVSMSLFSTSGNVIENGDGQNDVAVTTPATIGGAAGRTLMIHSLCVFSSSWSEADVLIASNDTFGKVGETSLPGNSARLAFLHEFGHAHGLAHAQKFNIMRKALPLPLVGGPGETVDVLPDDANVGRFLYPNGNKEVNLFASADRRTANDKIVLNNTGTLTVCAKGGANVTLTSTVGNNGTVNIQQTERWWVNPSDQGHSDGIQISEWSGSTFIAGSVNTRQVSFKMPALPPGTYFLFHGVDMLNEVTESRENDNNVREGMKIQVNNC
jgi:hypothetical protein